MQKENIIISLGGSLVAPNQIDVEFLKAFRKAIQKYTDVRRFFVFVGGGKVCRDYQKALLEFGADNSDRDWMGINISRLNAEVVRQSFGETAFSQVLTDPTKKISTRRDVLVFGGWKPGWSTDYCAAMLAKNMGIKTILNVTNIDYVFDKDPRKFKDARALESITWKEFRKLVGNKWTPGLSLPFDPRASKMAELLKIKVMIVNGGNIKNLEDFLSNKSFIGTTIS